MAEIVMSSSSDMDNKEMDEYHDESNSSEGNSSSESSSESSCSEEVHLSGTPGIPLEAFSKKR